MASLALALSSLITLLIVVLIVSGFEPVALINPALLHLEGF